MPLTKQDIDALVDGLPKDYSNTSRDVADNWVFVDALRRALYLAAGLTAEGERKPERVRLWRGKSSWTGRYIWFEQEPKPDEFLLADLTPGWFVPSEEGET